MSARNLAAALGLALFALVLLCGEAAHGAGIPRQALAYRATLVRVWHGEVVEGMPTQSSLATTCTDPVQLLDGRWHVVVVLYGQGMAHVPCELVEVVR